MQRFVWNALWAPIRGCVTLADAYRLGRLIFRYMVLGVLCSQMGFAAGPKIPEGSVGKFTFEPETWPVYEKTSGLVVYEVGEGGMSTADAIRLYDPVFHGMRLGKWGYLTTSASSCSEFQGAEEEGEPGSAGLVTANTPTEGVTLSVSRNTNDESLHMEAYTEVEISEGALEEGDVIRIVIGDTANNELCGLQSPPKSYQQVEWKVAERLGGAKPFTESVGPFMEFVSNLEAVTIFVAAPSQALVGEPFSVAVTPMDALGNPVTAYLGPVKIGDNTHVFQAADRGTWSMTTVLDEAGTVWLEAEGRAGLTGRSNPIVVDTITPDRQVYWGDIHVHHGHSFWGDFGIYHDENHEYARDVAGLQVACESMKTPPLEIDSAKLWNKLRRACQEYTVDGEYVALLGFEWMGNESVSNQKPGHHNVYYDSCIAPIADTSMDGLSGDSSLWAFMAEVEADFGARAVSIPHASNFTGFNWEERDNANRPVAEIYSEWGDSSGPMNDDGSSVYDGLAMGNRLGFIGSSDNHDGWMGNRFAVKNVGGGLAAFVATDLSRAGIFEAIELRSTYGTSGIRPVLRFWAEDGASVNMGEEYISKAPTFHWSYDAENTLSSMELMAVAVDGSSGETTALATWTPNAASAEGEASWQWDGTPMAVWLVATEDDGEMAWSSPIWLSGDCDNPSVLDPAGRCNGDSGSDSAEDDKPKEDTDTQAPTNGDTSIDTANADDGPQASPPNDGVAIRCGCAVNSDRCGGLLTWLLTLFALVWARSNRKFVRS